jgi:hypothetical protein
MTTERRFENPFRLGYLREADAQALLALVNAIEGVGMDGANSFQLLYHARAGWLVHNVGVLFTDSYDEYEAEVGGTAHRTLLEALTDAHTRMAAFGRGQ